MPQGERHYDLLHVEPALTKNGDIFIDRVVHKILREDLGRKQLPGESGRRSEWFECTIDDVKKAITSAKTKIPVSRSAKYSFAPRPEQTEAVKVTANYYRNHPYNSVDGAPRFLWNAKMRFGKTFATYQLAKEMGWSRVLVLTYKPAVQNSWKEDLLGHSDFEEWQFIGGGEEYGHQIDESKKLVWFASFQDVNQRDRDGNIKDRLVLMHAEEWDCIVIDEYHYGAWREAAKEIYMADRSEKDTLGEEFDEKSCPLTTKHFLYLSGTPFRAIATGDFMENQIFNWTYADEQAAKQGWDLLNPGKREENPYRDLPKLVLLTYKMPDELRGIAQDGEFNEFDLNTFFKATRDSSGKAVFDRELDVSKWLQLLQGRWLGSHSGTPGSADFAELPFADIRLRSVLRHTLWFLPDVASCEAMGDLLKKDEYFSEYNIVVAAGVKAGIGVAALPPVEAAIGPTPTTTRSITLTCGKLTTGVTVKAWSGVFMLRETSSPEAYFQTVFRAQSPWTVKVIDGEIGSRVDVMKDVCYVLDFAPIRAFEKINDYALRLTSLADKKTPEERVQELLNYLPVLAYDGSTMEEVNCGTLLDVVATGIGATMLARKWTSSMLVNVNGSTLEKLLAKPDLVKALQSMESFSNLNIKVGLERSINTEKDLSKTKKDGKKPSDKQNEAEKESNSFRRQLRDNLIKFASRVPIFMYLTQHREAALKDVIESLDTDLFVKVTGLSKENFKEMCELGLFNPQLMDEAVLAFRRFEESSLVYLDTSLSSVFKVAGWVSNSEQVEARAQNKYKNYSKKSQENYK
jgi:hypothetical protein